MSSTQKSERRRDDDDNVVYQKMDHHRHLLERPDSYVGSTEPTLLEGALVAEFGDGDGGGSLRLARRDLAGQVPALLKIIDEILVNACDQYTTTRKLRGNKRMRSLDVEVDAATGRVRVTNDGRGIAVKRLKEHDGMYAPELVFGNLLTSSNYDDARDRVTGGRNGYGAKCTNVYSTEFVVETCDGKRVYRQTWRRNMYDVGEPAVRKAVAGADAPHTTVEFVPDFARLGGGGGGGGGFGDDTMGLLRRRVVDVAAWCRGDVAVTFNGTPVPVGGLGDFARALVGDDRPVYTHRTRDGRWEVVATCGDSGTFEQVSFVNGIHTRRGGRHVDHVAKPLAKALAAAIAKREKIRVTSAAVRSQLLLLVRAVIVNPAFDGQVKELLTTPVSRFGSRCELPKGVAEKLLRAVPELSARVAAHAQYRNSRALRRTDGAKTSSIRGIPKLCDATRAGTRRARQCTLILTEGDSAKTMAISGLAAVPGGRDVYGVFPLKGKLLNVRGVDPAKIAANAEIAQLKRILGLKTGMAIDPDARAWPLRYGSVVIMTDQDVDGSHIKGLLANLFHAHWPSLLRLGFVSAIVTPIVKVWPRRGAADPLLFYNLSDYDGWCRAHPRHAATHRAKYYKGLGTSSAAEAREYFGRHRREVAYEFGDRCDEALRLAFDKTRADDRKAWLGRYESTRVLDATRERVQFADFVHDELVHFSHYDVHRSIPSATDGLKPSQRKVLFACLKRRLTQEIKVAQLAGYVSEHAAYHHGEVSLHGTIVNMAQDFVGTNNLALLAPCGQFGSRLQGGADAASPRYIFTRLTDLAPLVFPAADLPLLEPLVDDGAKIEPARYVPVIPLVLVNGAKGIGTGWSTAVPPHHPLHVVARVRQWIAGGEGAVEPLEPWFRGFRGVVERVDERAFLTRGCCQLEGDARVRVTELPVGVWTEAYKGMLEKLIAKGSLGVVDYEDRSTPTHVDLLLTFETAARLEALQPREDPDGFQRKIGLVSRKRCGYTNMHLFAADGRIRRFETTAAIVADFCEERRRLYERRYAHDLAALVAKRDLADEKRRFVEEVVAGTVVLRNKPIDALEDELEARGYDPARGPPPETGRGRFRHLHGMPLSALTLERIGALRDECAAAEEARAALAATTPLAIWEGELAAVETAYAEDLAARLEAAAEESTTGGSSGGAASGKRKKKRTRRKR